jgi:hypothetical protein
MMEICGLNCGKAWVFCNTHAWELLEPGVDDTLGVAIIYHDALQPCCAVCQMSSQVN